MKVLVCGDREWKDKAMIKSQLQRLSLQHDNVTIIHGAARGADSLAAEAAKELGFEVLAFPADWSTYHKSAGPIRNRQMINERPDFVWAFHDNLRDSKGTKDMVKVAGQLGYKVTLFCHEWARSQAGSLL